MKCAERRYALNTRYNKGYRATAMRISEIEVKVKEMRRNG